jgi:hypothetical protein
MLHKLWGRASKLQTSLYADDAAIFVAPIKEDIRNLALILENFGDVTGRSTSKSVQWPLSVAMGLTFTTFLQACRPPKLPSRCDILGYRYRFDV